MVYWRDIDITLDKKQNGDIKDDVDVEAVKNSILNILSTMQGSRRMVPTFAVALYEYLFEPIDEITAEDIGQNVLEAIETWDDRVIVDEVMVYPNYDSQQYDIRITFHLQISYENKETLKYILRRG